VGPEFLVFAVLLPVWTAMAVLKWTGWLRRRTATPPWARAIAFFVGALGVLALMAGMCTAVAAPEGRQVCNAHEAEHFPSECAFRRVKTETRRETISNGLSLGGIGVLVLVFGVAWLLGCTWRWHWALRPPRVEGLGPYR
jgi:hypothetical protein